MKQARFVYVYHAWISSWNQSELWNMGIVSYSRK